MEILEILVKLFVTVFLVSLAGVAFMLSDNPFLIKVGKIFFRV
jgi:hypothetical protein